jgi:hypothetical protein
LATGCSWQQIAARQDGSAKMANKMSDNVEKFRYFGTAATNQNCRPQDIVMPATTVFPITI